MNKVDWKEIAVHLAAQAGTLVLIAAVGALAKMDWSELGSYAPYAQAVVAMLTSVVNQATRK